MSGLKRTIVTFTLLTTLLSNPLAHADMDKARLDQLIQNYIKDKPVKSIIYGFWKDGKPVSVNAIGYSMTGVPATTDMHYRIGGIAETMLTATMMLMVQENKIQLDEKISRWYPNIPNADKITLKMLANCTSGIPDYVYNKKFIDDVLNNPFKSWSDQELIDYALLDKPKFLPGTDQQYSHTDYVILGSILTQVSHMNMDALLNHYVFKKLNMKHTHFNRNASITESVLHSYSQDRNIYEDATYWDPSWTSYSGAIYSNINELGIWANAWMKPGLLSEKVIAELRAPDSVGKGRNTKNLYFAMGFVSANHWLVQNPRFGGYSGVYAVLPEKNMVFIAVNTLQPSTTDEPNLSFNFWKKIAADLAPEYPVTIP